MTVNTRIEEETIKYQRAIFGERYVGASISQMQIPQWAAEKIHDFMVNPKKILVFLSKPGIGKTYMCAALTEWMLITFRTFRYHREYDLLKRLREGISNSEGDYLKNLELLTDDELVILDDVGSGIDPIRDKHKDLEWRKEVFFSFLDQRYNSMLPTIITSNFSKNDFGIIYPERVNSRLFASENTIIELFDNSVDDQRKNGK